MLYGLRDSKIFKFKIQHQINLFIYPFFLLFSSLQFVVLSVLGLAAAAKLPNSYIPPPNNAATAGGSHFLQAPNQQPSNQYLPPGQQRPQQSYNHVGQPTSFSQGSYSQQQYQPQQQSYQGGQQYQPQGQQYRPSGQPHIPILRYENVNNGDGSYHFE